MSKYTRELRYIYENELNMDISKEPLALINILNNFPLENENLINPLTNKTRREELKNKIIEHFYFREIGFETDSRFLFNLKRKLNEIMPLYNQKYKSVDLDINPINNVDMTESFTHSVSDVGKTTSNGTSNNTSNNIMSSLQNGDNLVVNSDTPNQGITEDDIKSNNYASSTTYNKDNNSNSTTSNSSSSDNASNEINQNGTRTEEWTRHETGSSKGYTFAQNIEQWRNIMINIDMEIINELEILFMSIW